MSCRDFDAIWKHAGNGHDKDLDACLKESSDGINKKYGPKSTTPLMEAMRNNHPSVVQLLLKHGANIAQADADDSVCIHYAAAHSPTCLEIILADQKDNVKSLINVTNSQGDTPLHQAALYGRVKSCELLILHGGKQSLIQKNYRKELPHQIAYKHQGTSSNIRTAELLFENHKAYKDSQTPSNNAPPPGLKPTSQQPHRNNGESAESSEPPLSMQGTIGFFDEDYLRKLADDIGSEWRQLGIYLSFSDADLDKFAYEHKRLADLVFSMLVKFNQKFSSYNEKLGIFKNACEKAGRMDLLEKQVPIQEWQLTDLAKEIVPQWKMIGMALGLSEAELSQIQQDHMADSVTMAFKMLKTWRNKCIDYQKAVDQLITTLKTFGLKKQAEELQKTLN